MKPLPKENGIKHNNMNFNVLLPAIDGGNTDDCPENLGNPYITQLIRPLLNSPASTASPPLIWTPSSRPSVSWAHPLVLPLSVQARPIKALRPEVMVRVSTNLSPHCKAWLDTNFMHQLMMHLLTNAANHIADGDIIIKYADENKGLRVTVTYIGIGQAELIGADIYSFLQKEDALKHVNESSVLGLSICKAIVDVLGGEFYMDTEYDKKTVASFWFPCKMRDTQKEHWAFSID